uniref:Uncharacterized protein n=1 Tax=Globodera rostochiensis TaxID=31243 RepID=A0A914H5I9_GLORO
MTSKRVNQSGGPAAKKWDFRTIGTIFRKKSDGGDNGAKGRKTGSDSGSNSRTLDLFIATLPLLLVFFELGEVSQLFIIFYKQFHRLMRSSS